MSPRAAARPVSGSTTADRDARQRLADEPAPRAGLEEPRRPVVERVHGDHRRALGHAVALQRADAEGVLERLGEHRLGQLLGAGDHQPERAELRGGAAAQVELEERRRRRSRTVAR